MCLQSMHSIQLGKQPMGTQQGLNVGIPKRIKVKLNPWFVRWYNQLGKNTTMGIVTLTSCTHSPGQFPCL